LDGTLVDTETLSDKAILFALRHVLDECWQSGDNGNFRLPWELKQQLIGLRGSDWGPIVLDYAANKWSVPQEKLPSVAELWSSWEDHLNSFCCQVEACIGAPALVEQCVKQNIPLAIATSSRMAAVDEKRKNHESMFSQIPIIVTGDDPAVKQGKPAPDIYFEAARRLGVCPSECLVFEDALSGVKSGKAAGCMVAAIPDSRFSKAEMKEFHDMADVVLEDLNHFDGAVFGLDIKMSAAC
jgi:beta-phosphoglucomutase-like phosphatase (HAD superfamily)